MTVDLNIEKFPPLFVKTTNPKNVFLPLPIPELFGHALDHHFLTHRDWGNLFSKEMGQKKSLGRNPLVVVFF